MKRAQQSQNQELTMRRSTRLTDKFQKLPDELTTKIFSKLEDDPKTLIRCSTVSKKWASFVFKKTVHLSFIFSCTPEKNRSFPNSKLHSHISSSAIPAIMNAFSNLESIEIKLCRCPSRTPQPPCCQNITKMNVVWTGDDSQADTCLGFDVGLLSTIEGTKLSHALSEGKKLATLLSSSVMDFYWTMIEQYRPKTLRRVVIMSAKMKGFRSGGKVFIRYEQFSKLRDSVSRSRVNERWLEDPQNVVYWHRKNTDREHLLQEQVWLVYHWQFILANRKFTTKDLSLKKDDVVELLDGLDAGAAGSDNGTEKRRSQYQQE